MNHPDLMTEIAEIITDIRRIEYNLNDPLRHCKSEAKRLAMGALSDAAKQARETLILISQIEHAAASAAPEAKL